MAHRAVMHATSQYAEQLEFGGIRCTPDELLSLWRMTQIRVRAKLPRVPFDFDGGASLAGRVRGALGHSLHSLAGGEEASLAVNLFFGTLPSWRPRTSLPHPFTIKAERLGTEIVSTLTLFGRSDVTREIMLRAFPLAFELGLSVDPRRGARRAQLRVLEADWITTQSVPPYVPIRDANLLFRTPMFLGTKAGLSENWDNLVVGLVERVAGMAFWQGMDINPDLGSWRNQGRQMVFDGSGLFSEHWERHSGRKGTTLRHMAGYRGRLIIHDPPAALLPYLALGETTFIGGNSALGLGRFDLLA